VIAQRPSFAPLVFRTLMLAALQRVTQRAVADRLLLVAADTSAAPEVRAVAEFELSSLRPEAAKRSGAGPVAERAHWNAIATDFARWLDHRELPKLSRALLAPPGDPFGMPGWGAWP
jgi:hypothetical protein